MNIQKTWLTVIFHEGKATIELTINYQTKNYSITHGTNDNNVTFNGDGTDFKIHFDRAKCVIAALKFLENEFKTK